MEHNNGGLEDYFPFQGVIFRFHVNFPGCIKIMIGRKVLT